MSKIERKDLNYYKLYIDFNPKSRAVTLRAKQNNTYRIKVYLTCNDIQQSLETDDIYYLRVQLPNGEKILCENYNQQPALSKSTDSSSSLEFYITPEITKYIGLHPADIAIYRADYEESVREIPLLENDTRYLIRSTQLFTIEVIPAAEPKVDISNRKPLSEMPLIISFEVDLDEYNGGNGSSYFSLWRGLEGVDDQHYYTVKFGKYIFRHVRLYNYHNGSNGWGAPDWEYCTKNHLDRSTPVEPVFINWFLASGDWNIEVGVYAPLQYGVITFAMYEEGPI